MNTVDVEEVKHIMEKEPPILFLGGRIFTRGNK